MEGIAGRYIALKVVDATPQRSDETREEGYSVEYEDGYKSWCPRDTFLKHNRLVTAAPFSIALEGVRRGQQWTRTGWNGPGQFIFLVEGSTFTVNRPPLLGIYPEGTEINYCPHIDMRNAQGQIVPWSASQGDVLSDDWVLVG